ncbi:MAG: hypothetical protein PHE15_06985, partial [Dehalococcoidales bacterium]|nr:hypothetical protein [Dehalococcoidales bacterium]
VDVIFDSLILPENDNWRECWFMKNSHLPEYSIETALKFSEVKEKFAALLTAPVTAYNLSYDRRVMRRHGLPIENVWPCLMQTCTPILKLPGYYNDYKYPKFSEAWHYFFPDLPFVERHRAAWDVLHEAKLAYLLYQQGFLKGR